MMTSLTDGVNDTNIEEDTPSNQTDSSVCTSKVLDATLGIQQLEDAAAEDQWCSSKSYGLDGVLHLVQISGMTVKKSRAITQQFCYVTLASSTDQLCCVAQES